MAQTSVGAGLSFTNGQGFNRSGISLRGQHYLNENFRIGGVFNYLFPINQNVFGFKIKANYYDLSANLHYVYPFNDKFSAYGVTGVNYFIATTKNSGERESFTNFGFEIGAGGEYQITDTISAFAELKFVISEGNRSVFTIGALYAL